MFSQNYACDDCGISDPGGTAADSGEADEASGTERRPAV